MAMYEGGVPVRKKTVTYGKSTTKRISGHSFDSVAHNPSIGPATAVGLKSQELKATGYHLTTISKAALDESKTATANSHNDVFEFPSDDDIDIRGSSGEDISGKKNERSRNIATQSKPGRRAESSALLLHESKEIDYVPPKYKSPRSRTVKVNRLGLNAPQGQLESNKYISKPKRKLPLSPIKSLSFRPSENLFEPLIQNSAETHNMSLSDGETKLLRPLLQERPKSSDQSGSQFDRSLIPKTGERSKKKFKSSPTSEPSYSPASSNPRATTTSRSRPTTDSHHLSLRSLGRESYKLLHGVDSRKNPSSRDSYEVNSISKSKNHEMPQLTPTHDANMIDFKPKKEKLSKSLQSLEDLLASTEDKTQGNVSICENTENIATSSYIARLDTSLNRPKSIGELATADFTKSRRPRLIDSLVQQASNADSSDDDHDENENDSEGFDSNLEHQPNFSSDYGSPYGSGSEILNEQYNNQLIIPENQSSSSSQSIGPRFTYSRQRSMLAEEDLMKELALEMPSTILETRKQKSRRGSISELKPLSIFYEEDDEENSQVVIKSVHELRKSGANKRFVDECIDFLDRIGSPGEENNSTRRSGLLDLASKMRQMNFVQQFRANSMERQLFIHLEEEIDIVSGFLIISILVSVLIEGTGPHIINHLCQQGIMKLVLRLIEWDTCISAVCENRKNNLSKVTQLLLIEHHNFLLHSDIWQELKPEVISSRTIALKSLDMMVRQIREAEIFSNIFPEELNTILFNIINNASDEESWDLPRHKKAVDFSLAVAALQIHSVSAYPLHEGSIWINDYLPKLAGVLELNLSRPQKLYNVQLQILKMILQVTNDSQLASEVFARPSLILILCRNMISQFQLIHSKLSEEKFKTTLDYLSLLLGILMNFSEWSPGTRQCLQNFKHQDEDPLEELLHIFSERSAGIAQAESEQETLKNVVLSYLAVSLGFLSQHPEISARIAPHKKSLVNCIEEFISIHKLADRKLVDSVEQSMSRLAEEDAHLEAQRELTERLERLVRRLKCTG